MTTNITNYNLLTINSLTSKTDPLSNITVNNSIKIPKSENNTNNKSGNSNAGIYIKDINSSGVGDFYRLHVNSNLTVTHLPSLYFNNNELIDYGNLLSNLEDILQYYTLETSNIIVQGGYINFYNGSIPNSNQGSTGVGLRYSSNNTVQFRNYDTDWIDLVDITKHDQFSELIDVDVHTNPLLNNQYITYNSSNSKFVNTNLAIINDKKPTLGGNLNVGDKLLQFSTTTSRLVYNSNSDEGVVDNTLLSLKNTTDTSNVYNYLEISNSDHDYNTSIIAKSTIGGNDVGITIQTLGTGNIELNASNGDVYTNSDSLIIGGYVKNSLYRTSSKIDPLYLPYTPFTVPLTNDTILFDFGTSSQAGTYWANIGEGTDGQKLNLVFNNKSLNAISVIADFTSNGIILGTGYGKGLIFDTIGQSSTLIYLGEGINSWQLLNTGSAVF